MRIIQQPFLVDKVALWLFNTSWAILLQWKENHYGRTLQDMKDRLFKGYDQQWAYATFSMPVTQVYAEQGLIKPEAAFTLEQSEKMLEEFIRKLAPLVIDKKKE
jgi:hypothetical protein